MKVDNKRATQLRELSDWCTHRPWKYEEREVVEGEVQARIVCIGLAGTPMLVLSNANKRDLKFIAAARQGIPDLLDDREGLIARIEHLEKELHDMVTTEHEAFWYRAKALEALKEITND